LFEVLPVVVNDFPPPCPPPTPLAQGKGKASQAQHADLLVPLDETGFALSDERDSLLWLRINVPADAAPGIYCGRVKFRTADGQTGYCPLALRVHDVILPKPADYALGLEVWQAWSPLAQQYGVEPFSEPWWELVEAYLRHLADLGAGTAQVGRTCFDWKRAAPGQWQFDFSRFDRYLKLCEKLGISSGISYLGMIDDTAPTQVHYFDAEGALISVEAEPGDEIYDEAWSAFAEALAKHCRDMGWFGKLYVWPADRPATDEQLTAFKHAVDLLRAADPDYRVAVTIDSAAAVPSLTLEVNRFMLSGDATFARSPGDGDEQVSGPESWLSCGPFLVLGQPPGHAYAAGPHAFWGKFDGVAPCSTYLGWSAQINVDTPQVRYRFSGLVYPGRDGPLASLRAERMRLGLQDVELWRVPGTRKTWEWYFYSGDKDGPEKLSDCAEQLRHQALEAASRVNNGE